MKKEKLPLAKLFQIITEGGLRKKFSTLYKIDERKDNNWKCIDKGVIDSQKQPISQNEINALYSKYRGNENYRIVIYRSFLTDFPEENLNNNLRLINTNIELLIEGIKIAKEHGFDFESVKFKQNAENKFKIQSKTTGLTIQDWKSSWTEEIEFKIDLLKFPHVIESIIPISFAEILSNSKSLNRLIISKLKFLLAAFKHELSDLKHRIKLNNKRSPNEIFSSKWHSSTSDIKSIYLLEFNQVWSFFMKWRLQKIEDDYSKEIISTEFFPSDDSLISVFPTLYLEHGSNKHLGVPYASFGHITFYEAGSIGSVLDLDYYYKRFLNEINEINIKKDFNRDKENKDTDLDELVGDLEILGFHKNEHENLETFTTLSFEDGIVSECLLNNVLHDIYCDPIKSDPKGISDETNIKEYKAHLERKVKILDCVEARQKNNSIWNVLEMDV